MKTLLYLLILTCFPLLFACECEELAPTEPETPETFVVINVFDLTEEGGEFLFITFNRPVNTSTFIPNQTFFVEGADIEFLDWHNSNQWVEIELFEFANCGQSDCEVELRLIGEEEGGVRSAMDEPLDGNRDGMPGDNYEEIIVGF